MKLTELLLKSDISVLDKKVERKVEISRLSKLYGAKFEFIIKNLTTSEMDSAKKESNKMISDKKGVSVELDSAKYNLAIVRMGTHTEDNQLFFANEELINKFRVFTPDDLIKKLLLPGEIDKLSLEIVEISGYSENALVTNDNVVENAVATIKN